MFALDGLMSLIAPHSCLKCSYEGAVVCEWCLPDIAPALPQRCYSCKAQTDNSSVCAGCHRNSRLKHVWVRTGYDSFAKQLVHDFKFGRKQAATTPIAYAMKEALPFLPVNTKVTHIPTANKRVRQRGYDHAELLAKALAMQSGLRFCPLLYRIGQTRQVGASRKGRLKQLEGAFQPNKNVDASPILLVDDLVTTGGTLEAAARCLKQAGAKEINAIVFAQKE